MAGLYLDTVPIVEPAPVHETPSFLLPDHAIHTAESIAGASWVEIQISIHAKKWEEAGQEGLKADLRRLLIFSTDEAGNHTGFYPTEKEESKVVTWYEQGTNSEAITFENYLKDWLKVIH